MDATNCRKRIIKGRPFGVGYEREHITYKREHPHEQ